MTLDTLIPSRHKLSTKIVGALVGFLALALFAIGVTLYLSWQLEGSAAAINDTGSLRMSSYRLAILLSQTGEGDAANDAPRQASAGQQMAQIDATLAQLRLGDPQRPLFLPPTSSILGEFERINTDWQRELRPAARALAAGQGVGDGALQRYLARTDRFAGRVNALVQLIERDSETRTFWLRASQLALLALALVGTVSLIYLMFSLIIEPVTRLHEGLHRMKDKDFEVRLAVDSVDEFGQLAQGFNQMADRLQALYGNLADLVQTKTAALEHQNRELALLYDSAAFLQRPQPVEPLCQGFLQRISDYFHADGGSVRVLDTGRDNLHMVVHHGLSPRLVEREHCMKVGDCLCGEAVQKKVTVIHDLRKLDKGYELECHREGFATVSVFHIYAHQQHLGFFNLHFRSARVLDAREQGLLETLGQLLGTAIENLRLGAREREMAVSEERNLVAQGLHDSIAQGLNFLNLQVQMLEQSVGDGKLGDVEEIVPALRAGVQESYEDVRELLYNFRSRLVEGSLVGALETAVDKFRRQTGIAAELVADVDGAPFPREQQLQLLFIVQEALSNVRKHAGASRVLVRLEDKHDFLLSIEDNGVGFDPALLEGRGDSHVGIHIMRERAQRIEATLVVTSSPGAGSTIALTLPQAHRRAA
ncbi:type IV pili methyl-accepting chemotaxis transducer N-terminal domain-containing protein [Massilia pseudoviolaceinigra]|uniref:type IV pili methyl-accepting chemotaxis transducer N-terminal domain-containing protein n=1 Tax=Massilia pseudoviolaceinigra TaxID=3057165 RepID=UPI00279693F9|nr:type IV pili methyl-accepting chemotaxis transducer N-terminal domain-containing protein [Massilia sp. CCM 9206]MDQ1923312.1 type IV pili methyl-accepting chemotaxis transducer N-terminal domain-containing protein [Massilia sp. CCM 9206]